MKIISHRCNTVDQLKATPKQYGIEIDIRSFNHQLILQHDPFTEGEVLDVWLKAYQHDMLILNVKEEGLESRLIELMRSHHIDDYFFLDQSFPFLVKYAKESEARSAVRVSEFESIETALSLAGKVKWVWVDCFTRFPLTEKDVKCLQEAGFKLYLVSPELQGRDPHIEIPSFRKILMDQHIKADAVCTKQPMLWE